MNSIQSIQSANLAAAQQRVASIQDAGRSSQQVDFGDLLRAAIAGTQPTASSTDVAQATQLETQSLAARARAFDITRLESQNIVDVAQAKRNIAIPVAYPANTQVDASGAFWTGNVDTSDGMIEKASPYMSIIKEASSVFGVPANVIMGVIKAESDYDPYCVSYSGAKGLMQIMPCNEEYYGVNNAFDPKENIFCGTHELSDLLNRYNGDLRLALAAYNTGPTRVANLGVTSSTDPAYQRISDSVRAYADRVMRYAGLTF